MRQANDSNSSSISLSRAASCSSQCSMSATVQAAGAAAAPRADRRTSVTVLAYCRGAGSSFSAILVTRSKISLAGGKCDSAGSSFGVIASEAKQSSARRQARQTTKQCRC
jgi:hypothetical protein